MGTNYYLKQPTQTDDTHRLFEIEPQSIHIGKFSNGWRFSFQGQHIADYTLWRHALKQALYDGWTIRDEYGTQHAYVDLCSLIDSSGPGRTEVTPDDNNWLDKEGWPFHSGDFS
tara:strand:- start:3067 stop:3408 length:342 start_codon:yes stop_codon:yes gene_type:complete